MRNVVKLLLATLLALGIGLAPAWPPLLERFPFAPLRLPPLFVIETVEVQEAGDNYLVVVANNVGGPLDKPASIEIGLGSWGNVYRKCLWPTGVSRMMCSMYISAVTGDQRTNSCDGRKYTVFSDVIVYSDASATRGPAGEKINVIGSRFLREQTYTPFV